MSSLKELPTWRPGPLSQDRVRLNRRQALRLLASGVASGLASCSKPQEQIIPYVRKPERLVPGEALKFATTLQLSGRGRGVIVSSIDGRPIKVEGNPKHPASLGATDVFAEAAVLSLYDPDRSRTILKRGVIASEEALRLALQAQLSALRRREGEGFRLLTGPVTSPTLLRQIDVLLQRYPKSGWHAHDPLVDANASAGATIAYGRPLQSLAHLDRARIVVALDADPLGSGPDQLRNAHAYAALRRAQPSEFSRIYCLEAAPSLTGAKADRRLALPPRQIGEVAVAIANAVGAAKREPALADETKRLVKQAAADLSGNIGGAVVLAGPSLPPELHALVYWINARLKAPI